MKVDVFRFPTSCPGDTAPLDELISEGKIEPHHVRALLCKTEGTGRLNDYSRDLAFERYSTYFSRKLSVPLLSVQDHVTFIFSSGCDGVISPHGYLFTVQNGQDSTYGPDKGLALGAARTEIIKPEIVGRQAHVLQVCEAVQSALREARIDQPEDVHTVFVKSPVYPGFPLGHRASSPAATRAASALGVAVALKRIREDFVTDHIIGREFNLYSDVAITFSGIETSRCQVILLGNSHFAEPKFRIAHGVLLDLLDVAGMKEALRSAGLASKGCLDASSRARVAGFFLKIGILPSGVLRDKRTTVFNSDSDFTQPLRAAASGIAAALTGDPEVFITAGAEHQGPPGGGIVSVIARM